MVLGFTISIGFSGLGYCWLQVGLSFGLITGRGLSHIDSIGYLPQIQTTPNLCPRTGPKTKIEKGPQPIFDGNNHGKNHIRCCFLSIFPP